MIVTHKIKMDLSRRGITPVVHMVQGDSNTRALEISLYDNGQPWEIPQGITAAVAFSKADGTKGLYDKLPDKSDATTLARSVVTAILAPEVLTCAGQVRVAIVLYDAEMDTLATFTIMVVVEANPAAGEQVSNNYYYLQNMDQVNAAYADILTRLDELKIEELELLGSSNLYVDAYIEAENGNVAAGINNCIMDAIDQGKEVRFTSGKTYEITEPIVIDNHTTTKKAIRVNFANANIVAMAEMEQAIKLTCFSHNGTVTSYLRNLTLDCGILAKRGIYAPKSTRMRMDNIDIKNGLNAAIQIDSGIETYIDGFSLWRLEAANSLVPNSVGLSCQATDCYFTNGVIVNYKTAGKSGPAVTWDNCHPWWYYETGEESNKALMAETICFDVYGQTLITGCEFDSGSICVKVNHDQNPKDMIIVDGCMLVINSMYANNPSNPAPTIIHLAGGNGNNVKVTNLNHYQWYPYKSYLCNIPNNRIQYNEPSALMKNLPVKDAVITNVADVISGDFIQLEATQVEILNSPSYVCVSNSNLFPAITGNIGTEDAPITQNGITIWKGEDDSIHLSGTAETATNFQLAGAWASQTPIMWFKAGVTYCFLRPNLEGVNLAFQTYDGNGGSFASYWANGVFRNPYEQAVFESELELTGVFLQVASGTVIDDLVVYPCVNVGAAPSEYVKSATKVIATYSSPVSCSGYTALSCKTGEVMSVRYKKGNVADMTDLDLLAKKFTISGDFIQLEATQVEILNSPSYVCVSNSNLFPAITGNIGTKDAPVTKNGITIWKGEDDSLHLSGTAETVTNFQLAGAWASQTPIMWFKAGVAYCLLRPNLAGVSLAFQTYNGNGESYTSLWNEGVYSGPMRYTPSEELEITGVFLQVASGTVIDDLVVYPCVNVGYSLLEYVKNNTKIITDYSDIISPSESITLVCRASEAMELQYRKGTLVSLDDFSALVDRVKALELLVATHK